MALPRLCSEGVKALARLAQQGGKQAQNRLHPACTTFSRSYAAEPVPAEGAALSLTKESKRCIKNVAGCRSALQALMNSDACSLTHYQLVHVVFLARR